MERQIDAMEALRTSIRQEFPKLTTELKRLSEVFGNAAIVNTLNESVQAQKNSNLLRLCEISMQRPELNLLSSAETKEILMQVKENIVPKQSSKDKTKAR